MELEGRDKRSRASLDRRRGIICSRPPTVRAKGESRMLTNIKALRQRTGKIALDELLSARHEGHKY
jgi:hypothetical protein